MPKNILLFMTDQQRAEYVGYAENGCGALSGTPQFLYSFS